MWNSLNRIGNTISIPGRLLKTWLTAWADIFDTLAAIPKDMKDVVNHTSNEIKNIFKSAVTKWKRYQKVGNTLLSPFVALWAAVEWAVRSVVTPTTNFVSNAFKSWKNLISNTLRSTFGSLFSKKPVSNFKYEELKTANIIEKNKNWFSKWRLSRKVFQDKQWENKNLSSKKPTSTWTTKEQENSKDSIKVTEKNDTEKKAEQNTKETPEKIEKNTEHRWVEEAKKILSDSPCGKIIIDGLCKNLKDFWIIFNDTTAIWSCNADHTITIWTKMPNWINELAPFNWETRDNNFQKKHLLLHELSHCTVHSHSSDIPGIQEWLDLIKHYIEDRKNVNWRTLSMLSYSNNHYYDTPRKKAREDFVEMLALRMNWNWNLCKKYLKLLSDD